MRVVCSPVLTVPIKGCDPIEIDCREAFWKHVASPSFQYFAFSVSTNAHGSQMAGDRTEAPPIQRDMICYVPPPSKLVH